MQIDDVIEALRAIGICVSRDAVCALITEATKTRSSPVETIEKLVALERGDRDRRNLDRRTR